jgi:hypothetical protein
MILLFSIIQDSIFLAFEIISEGFIYYLKVFYY